MFGCGNVVFICELVFCSLSGFCNFIFQLLQFFCPEGSIVPSGSTGEWSGLLCSLQNGLVEILKLSFQGLFLVIDTGCFLVCEICEAFPICLFIVLKWGKSFAACGLQCRSNVMRTGLWSLLPSFLRTVRVAFLDISSETNGRLCVSYKDCLAPLVQFSLSCVNT